MPMNSVKMRPGVNTILTPSLNEAGVSQSNMIRYQYQNIQKAGGWNQYWPSAIGSTVKEIWGWQSLSGNKYLGVGATASLEAISSAQDVTITPQTRTSDTPPRFSISSGSNIVTIVDGGSSVSIYSSIYLNTPIAIGNLLLNGAYAINSVGGSSTYTILSSVAASTTIVSSGILPFFTTTANSALVDVVLPNHNFTATPGLFQQFIAPTTLGGITIQGAYQLNSVIDSTDFTIGVPTQASSAATSYMNSGNAEIVYYYTVGPPSAGGYGSGSYGSGGYGTGSPAVSGTGSPITVTDWSLTNWGEALIACPKNGPLYIWSPSNSFSNAQVISQAPFFNGGVYISQPQQILVCWKSVQTSGVQDPLIVRWSDSASYTQWAVTSQTFAGSFKIPTGSTLRGGLQAATQGILWTDIGVWVQQYVGQPLVFSHTEVGKGCGLVGQHAAGVLNGNVYWMGPNNFFVLTNSVVQPIPCTVWNYVFENIDTNNLANVRCATNNLFNEVTWFFPQIGGLGQNTLYVKLNTLENEWDYGSLGRTAWIDTTVLGNPIGTDTNGNILQHEIGYNAGNNTPIASSFQSGYWAISDGNDMAFVDWVLPDMQFSTYGGTTTPATVNITLYATDFPGDTPRTYGPYPFTSATEYINTRLRGRLMSIKVDSSDLGSFWRLGRVRYRWAPAGRR